MRYEVEERIATITLDRPEVRNALSAQVRRLVARASDEGESQRQHPLSRPARQGRPPQVKRLVADRRDLGVRQLGPRRRR